MTPSDGADHDAPSDSVEDAPQPGADGNSLPSADDVRLPSPDDLPRREFLKAAVAVGGASALSACLGEADDVSAPDGTGPDDLPARQHAWNHALDTDEDDNHRAPRHHLLLSLELADAIVTTDDGVADAQRVDEDARETVADALQELEHALEWSSEGLLFTIGYSPTYFDRFDASLPDSVDLPDPEPLTALENPERIEFDTADALLHLASDDAEVVLAAEEALLGERDRLNDHEVAATFSGILERTDRRTGFKGVGLPAQKQAEEDLGNMPQKDIPEEAPLFMGFRAGFRESQATEDRVTIDEGPFAGGSTEHVESVRLQLRSWFDQDTQSQRVEKMFSPSHAADDAVGQVGERLSTVSGAAAVADDTREHANTAGVVGHAQKAARAREDGEPLLLRRDFDTTDEDFPGLHFLSLQSSISEFVRVREAMAGEDLTDTAVGRRVNNGILEYLTVRSRGNFLVPPREHRALPTPRPQ